MKARVTALDLNQYYALVGKEEHVYTMNPRAMVRISTSTLHSDMEFDLSQAECSLLRELLTRIEQRARDELILAIQN